ncbi:MAG TPA: hypothetical protein VEB18_03400 [Candidatus Paceibacterota bacterium]|nr:hypothetical protein [Candidatus Paceibacterota bacterium]
MRTLYDEDELTLRIIASQFLLAGFIAVGLIGVAISEHFWPNFFQYRYFYVSPNFLEDVGRYWPLFAYAGVFAVLTILAGRNSDHRDGERFIIGIGTSVGAGVLEEGWYRWVGVFYSMLFLVLLNFLFSAFGWGIVVAAGIAILFTIASFFIGDVDLNPATVIGRILLIALFALAGWGVMAINHDPVYWVYLHIFVPVIDFATFGLMHSALHANHQPLLVMGLIAANFAFRDGHKYQGLYGWVNSWYIGCAMTYATLTYGLAVAVAVHALYDIIFDVAQYIAAKRSMPRLRRISRI